MRVGPSIAVFGLAGFLAACSGSAVSSGANGGGSTSQPLANDAVPANYAGPAAPMTNAQPQPVSNRFDLGRRPRLSHTGVGPASNVPLEYRAAPENSETATTMNDQGQAVEERVFKDHPQLDRVEAVWLGEKQKLLKITFKNGQTVEIKTDQVPTLASTPSELLVQLGGGPK